ncbi:MAG: PqqD family peptide modification chaperone, partial [Phycisphaerae bacterium]
MQITRQGYLGRRWYVVQDPSSNGFYRLNPVAHEMVALLDGSRTVDEVWQLGLTRHGDEALTQNDVITVLSQLYGANLLQADIAPETEQLLSRGNERRKKKFIGQAIGLMYFRIPLFNPNGILAMIEPVMRPLLNKWGFVAWLALVVTAIAALVPHWRTLVGGFDSAIAPSNWPILLASYVVLKLWHETGHGVICKRFGGQVPVFGAMMLVLVPSPYVDASASWSFRSKWQRIAVGGGGMMFELFVAAIAAFVWLGTKDNPGLVHQVAYNVMLTSGVSTVVF